MEPGWVERQEANGDCTVSWVIHNVDCLDFLRTLPDGSVDAVVTDPPYGVGVQYGSFNDTREELKSLIARVMPELLRVSRVVAMTPGNGNQWLYPDPDWEMAWFEPAGTGMCKWGFQCWHPILLWGKCPYLASGRGGRPDVFSKRWDKVTPNGHPCPKPESVMRWLVQRVSMENTTILDPFAGSGTTGVACIQTGRNFIGCEIDAGYAEIARRRCREAEDGAALFTEKKQEVVSTDKELF